MFAASARAAAFGAFMNQGQICMASERTVFDDNVADAVAQHLVARGTPSPRARCRSAAAMRPVRSWMTVLGHVTPTLRLDAEESLPCGKARGHGRLGGAAVIDECTELRWILVSGRSGTYLI